MLTLRLKNKWDKFHINTKAAIFMIFSAICFAILTSLIRHLSAHFHLFELIFFRSFFGMLFILPWAVKGGLKTLKTAHLNLQILRSLIACIAMYFWFYSISNMPLAEATAINYIAPIFAIIIAIVVLGEKIRIRRILAVIGSFIGMLIIIRPGVIEVNSYVLSAVIASFFMATGATIVKVLAKKDHPNSVVFYMPLLLSIISVFPSLLVWKNPDLANLSLLVLTGLTATLAHQGMTRAFALAEATYVLAFDYLRLPFVALIGFLIFAEIPSIWSWVGAGVILGSSLYIIKREKIHKTTESPSISSARRTN